MVVAVDKVAETVAVVTRPRYKETSVYSQLDFSDHRRHREVINFRPVLHPVRYADTFYLYLNNTRRRFVSRTYYEPRVRPRSYEETTFANPKTLQERFVSYLDVHADENRKWFKTSVEITGKKFRSAQILRTPNNNYLDSANSMTTTVFTEIHDGDLTGLYQNGPDGGDGARVKGRVKGQGFVEKVDPGASQVYIPKRSARSGAGLHEEVCITFPNSKVQLNRNGEDGGYSDI